MTTRTRTMKTDEERFELELQRTKLGVLLEEKRKIQGLSYRKAAKLTGVSHSYIQRAEESIDPRTGNPVKVSPDILKRFAVAYNCSYEELLDAANYSTLEVTDQDLHSNPKSSKEKTIKLEREKLLKQRLIQSIAESHHSIDNISLLTKISIEKLQSMVEGKSKPKLEEIYNLAAVFRVTPDYLAGYINDPNGTHPDMPQLTDLLHFINTTGLKLFGQPLDDDQKQKIEEILKKTYLDAQRQRIDDTLLSIYANQKNDVSTHS